MLKYITEHGPSKDKAHVVGPALERDASESCIDPYSACWLNLSSPIGIKLKHLKNCPNYLAGTAIARMMLPSPTFVQHLAKRDFLLFFQIRTPRSAA